MPGRSCVTPQQARSEWDVVVLRTRGRVVVVGGREVTAPSATAATTATPAALAAQLCFHGRQQCALLVMPTRFGRVVERATTTGNVELEVLHRSPSDRRALAAPIRREHQSTVPGRGGLTEATRRRRVGGETYRKLAQAEPEAIASADRGADANGFGRPIGALNEYRDGKALIVHLQAMAFGGAPRQTKRRGASGSTGRLPRTFPVGCCAGSPAARASSVCSGAARSRKMIGHPGAARWGGSPWRLPARGSVETYPRASAEHSWSRLTADRW
jgi:hypothetical protein